MATNPDPTAVMGRRIGAALIDGAVVFVPSVLYMSSQMESFEYSSSDEATDKCTAFNDLHESGICVNAGSSIYFTDDIGPGPLVLLGLSFALFVVLQGLTGWTIGKLATGIRVVAKDTGAVPGVGRALVRWLLWIVDSLPLLWLVGIITAGTSTGHRRVGDMAGGTLVVRADAAGHPPVVAGLTGGLVVPGAMGGYSPTGLPAPSAKPGPQWDEARSTYIQWDPELQAWMQWHEDDKRWDPISTAPPPPTDAPPPPPPPPPPPA